MPVKTSRVCVVLASCPGGGQEGAVTELLHSLRAAQVDVTVLDAAAALLPIPAESVPPGSWAPVSRAAGAIHVVLPDPPLPLSHAPLDNSAPYAIFVWLRDHPFDLVIAELTGGMAYFPLAARRTGVAFLQTTIAILLGNATGLELETRGLFPDHPVLLQRDYLEQCCVAWADGLLGGTEPQHAWFGRRGWACAPRAAAWSELRPMATEPVADGAPPQVTVALVHHERPALLRQAVRSLIDQQDAAFEVVLVDDGSRSTEARACLAELEPEFRRRDWRIVRQANAYLGAARNHAVREARGEYVLFMDEDNLARPNEVAVLARAARRTGADALTCFFDVFEGAEPPGGPADIRFRYLPIGGSLACGVFSNCFGDANAFVRREALLAVGGFSEMRNVGTQDYALFARLLLAGYRLEVVPEALFLYRSSATGMRLVTEGYGSQQLVLAGYRAAVPPGLAALIDFSAGAANRIPAESHACRVLQAERDHWRAHAQAMERSMSWRLTRGLRWLRARAAGRPTGTAAGD